MTLLHAQPPDPRLELRARRLRQGAAALAILLMIGAALAFWFRHWPEERVVDQFFQKIEQKDYASAFAIWNADPEWQQHVERYVNYPFGQFQLDWGPTGDFGTITSHAISRSVAPPSKVANTSGVVVIVQVNQRLQPSCLWVEVKTKTISFSHIPCQL